jgi:hypothetical protein
MKRILRSIVITVGLLLTALVFTGLGLDDSIVDTVHASDSLSEPNFAPQPQEVEPTFSPPMRLLGSHKEEEIRTYTWAVWVVGVLIVVLIAVGAYFLFRKK